MATEDLAGLLAVIGIDRGQKTLEEVREELLAVRKNLHPDRSGGNFKDEASKEQYFAADKALEVIAQLLSAHTQLVPLSQVQALMQTLIQAQHAQQVPPAARSPERDVFTRSQEEIKGRYIFPKITSGVVLAASMALLSFLGTYKDNATYRNVRGLILPEMHSETIKLTSEDVLHTFLALGTGEEVNLCRVAVASLPPDEVREIFKEHYPYQGRRERLYGGPSCKEVGTEQLEKQKVGLASQGIAQQLKFWQREMGRVKASASKNLEYLSATAKPLEEKLKDKRRDDPKLKGDFETLDRMLEEKRLNSGEEYRADALLANFTERVSDDQDRADNLFATLLAVVAAVSLVTFCYLWIRERSDRAWIEFLGTDDGLRHALEEVAYRARQRTISDGRFTKSVFVQAIAVKPTNVVSRVVFGRRVDSRELENLADILLERLKGRHAIVELSDATLDPLDRHFEREVRSH